jgi:hypothetical protein
MDNLASTSGVRLRDEWRACFHFIFKPRLQRELKRRLPASGRLADWLPNISLARLLGWAATLWVLNIFALGPIVLAVFEASGAKHRIDVNHLPWVAALIWAPLVEELLFRLVLRQPLQALWVVPLMVGVLYFGLHDGALMLLAATIAGLWCIRFFTDVPSASGFRYLRYYRNYFPWVFHLASLAFAAVHIRNFEFADIAWWMMVILVAPQWITGLVLGWMRVQRGLGASILLHALFNLGPLSVAWLALKAGLE